MEDRQSDNVKRSIELLSRYGYESEPIGLDATSILVQDPVRCSSGSRVWVEYHPVALSVSENLRFVRRFIVERD